jgi:hypothetical protein
MQHRHIQWQASLQKEVDEYSDATVVMKDAAEQDTYSMSDKMHKDSDSTVMTKDGAKQNTYSQSGEETKVKRSKFGKELGICNTVCREDEIYISNRHFRHATNAKMLFL